MKRICLTICLIGYSYITLAQNGSTYYRYNPSTGVSEKAGYIEPGTPNKAHFAPYTPSVDVNLYRDAIKQKQNDYDRNAASLRKFTEALIVQIDELYKLDKYRGDKAYDQLMKFLDSLDPKNDYSKSEVYTWAMQNLNVLQGNIKRMREGAIEEINGR